MVMKNGVQRPRPTINIVPSAEKFNDTIERRLYISITYADNKGNRIVVHGEEENAAMRTGWRRQRRSSVLKNFVKVGE